MIFKAYHHDFPLKLTHSVTISLKLTTLCILDQELISSFVKVKQLTNVQPYQTSSRKADPNSNHFLCLGQRKIFDVYIYMCRFKFILYFNILKHHNILKILTLSYFNNTFLQKILQTSKNNIRVHNQKINIP